MEFSFISDWLSGEIIAKEATVDSIEIQYWWCQGARVKLPLDVSVLVGEWDVEEGWPIKGLYSIVGAAANSIFMSDGRKMYLNSTIQFDFISFPCGWMVDVTPPMS